MPPELTVPDDTDDAAPAPDQDTDDAPEAAPAPPPPKAPERVQLPQQPMGRRARAAAARDELAGQVKALQDSINKSQQDYRDELARRDAEIANLKGRYEALQPLVQKPADQAPDPEALKRQADEALDKGNYSEWRRLNEAAQDARFEKKLADIKKDMAPAPPAAGPNPIIQGLLVTSKNVMAAGERGFRLVQLKDQELALRYNMPDGPERWTRAFQMIDAELGANNKNEPAGFTQQAAGALAAVPTTRNAGGKTKSGPAVELTDLEKAWAERAGMTLQEYADELAKAHPERVTT